MQMDWALCSFLLSNCCWQKKVSFMSHLTESVELRMALNMYEKCVRDAASHFHSEVVKKWQAETFCNKMYHAHKYGQK